MQLEWPNPVYFSKVSSKHLEKCTFKNDHRRIYKLELHTCRNRRGPCQPIVKSAVAVVQPILVSRPRQTVPELYDVTDVGGGYGCVWRWRTDRRTIIQTIPGTTLAQVTWYLDREIGRVRDLKRNTKERC